MKLSWVGWLNILLLQWLFVRLYRAWGDDGKYLGAGLIFPVVPLSGWWSDYIPKNVVYWPFWEK